MKANSGMVHIKAIILMIIIAVFVAGGVYFVRMKYNEAKIQTIKTNLLLVQSKIKEYEGKQKVSGQEMTYIGTKVSQMSEDEIVKPILEKEVINSEDYEKYYVLNDEDLEKLNIPLSNDKCSYYIINYENYEVIITSGCTYNKDKTLYKLSEIQFTR